MERNIQKRVDYEINTLFDAKLRNNIRNIVAERIDWEIHIGVLDEVLLRVSNIIWEIRDQCDERI